MFLYEGNMTLSRAQQSPNVIGWPCHFCGILTSWWHKGNELHFPICSQCQETLQKMGLVRASIAALAKEVMEFGPPQ